MGTTCAASKFEELEVLPPRRQPFRSWRPLTLQPWILLPFATCCAVAIVTLEYLSHLSRRDGGIYSSIGEFPTGIDFVRLYLPTIVPVLLSMTWSWIDLDARRLEPFFQLSRPQGCSLDESLDLQYPFDYLAWVPFKALKRRHWSVVLASCNTVFLFWVITPLLSATFTTSITSQTRNQSATVAAMLGSVSRNGDQLSSNFQMEAYGSLWLGQQLPGFVTNDSAVLPFVVNTEADTLGNETWQAVTTAYSTSLKCEPAKVAGKGYNTTYSSSKGCSASAVNLGSDTAEIVALYIGYYSGPASDYYLQTPLCSSPTFSHTFLAYWSVREDGESKTTVLFCEPSYWQTEAEVRVHAINKSVIDIQPIGSASPLTDNHLNITAFEYALGTGITANSSTADLPFSPMVIDQSFRLAGLGISPDNIVTNMVGFALGATKRQARDYIDPVILETALEKAHKLLFALAARSLFVQLDSESRIMSGEVHGTMRSLKVIRQIALASEIALGIVIFFTLILIAVNWRRPIELRKDPASLASVLSLMKCSDVRGKPKTNDYQHDDRAKIESGLLSVSQSSRIGPRAGGRSLFEMCLARRKTGQPQEDTNPQEPVRPFEMRLLTGTIFHGVLLLALCTLVIIQKFQSQYNGLRLPPLSAISIQIITNYIPVAFATLLEPFWTLLNRTMCVFKPFHVLSTGDARPSASIYLKYTSLLPPLVAWRAMKARHFLLVTVCLTGLSTNILTVALGSLFQMKQVKVEELVSFNVSFQPVFKADDVADVKTRGAEESFYTAKANISDGVDLPRWTTKEAFFLPLEINQSSISHEGIFFRVNTIGFGSNLTCYQVDTDSHARIAAGPRSEADFRNTRDGGEISCVDTVGYILLGQNNSKVAAELFRGLAPMPGNSLADNETCDASFIVLLLRGNITVSADERGILSVNSLSSLWMICRPTFSAAPYEVVIDSMGRIQEARRVGSYASNLSPYFSEGLSAANLIKNSLSLWTGVGGTSWHNDTASVSWFGYFIKKLANSTNILDPEKDLPDLQDLVPIVQDMHNRVFAIFLGLYRDRFLTESAPSTTTGWLIKPEQKLFMSKSALTVSITLLSLHIVVAFLFYFKRPNSMPMQMPTTIRNVLDMFDGSSLVSIASRDRRINDSCELAYGKFVGTDGKPHVGIEQRAFVIPLRRRR